MNKKYSEEFKESIIGRMLPPENVSVPELVRETLQLPADWEPLGLMTLGYPAEEKTKTRRPVDSRVIWL